jgi:N-terminal domain of (some) glycogen debranching enzymes
LDDQNVTQNCCIATEKHPADDRTRVLKHGDMFTVFDRYGDIEAAGLKEQGMFCEGTRFLSQLEFQLAYVRPFLLSSTIKADNSSFAAHFGQRGYLTGWIGGHSARHVARAENQISMAGRLL